MHVDEERLKTARLLGLVIEINGQQRLLLRGVHHQRPTLTHESRVFHRGDKSQEVPCSRPREQD